PDPLTHLGGFRNDAAVPVDPKVVAKSDRVYHQRVARPRRRRISLPRRIRILWQRTGISEYLTVNAIILVQHHKKVRRVDKLEIVREPIRAQKEIRKTPDVRIIYSEVRCPLLYEGRKPRLIRQPAGQVHAHVDTLPRHRSSPYRTLLGRWRK